VYSMVTRSPFWGMGPLPSERIVFVTPMFDAVVKKVLVVKSLVADVRNEERNMWSRGGRERRFYGSSLLVEAGL
jgi:hypothetical protein